MTGTATESELAGLGRGSHVCWITDDPANYVTNARVLLQEATGAGQKPIIFGPERSSVLAELAPSAAIAVDPLATLLGGGALDSNKMFSLFRDQSALARAEGYVGVRVVADMDWIASTRPSTDSIVSFELMLGSLVREVEATIVCAYRPRSFDTDAILGVLAVHELAVGHQPPQFRFFAADADTWQLSGEVDLAVASTLEVAISHAARGGDGVCLLDVSALEFIDVAGMRQITRAARASDQTVRLVNAPPRLRRVWHLAGFAQSDPAVELVG